MCLCLQALMQLPSYKCHGVHVEVRTTCSSQFFPSTVALRGGPQNF